ncbi:hypothetical protein [Pseudoduganella buxea]|uniref:PEP-CTERM sorting domain-containing protein n=1 Tax=Pseudoduganella buxea TaxID=1949069 RepID=A0A6I3SYU1_9BURK|nr:hypothetical protein [Pseudoduganella buxea]MTV54343.1 hypothetical protein [Pseudoduganella buxea]GGC03812.1 hypothetical protein GCM10011572_27240 [Pseudoduganella buxea]
MTKVLAALTLLLSCTASHGAQVAVAAAQSSTSLVNTAVQASPQAAAPARARSTAIDSVPVAPLLATGLLLSVLGFRRQRNELFR